MKEIIQKAVTKIPSQYLIAIGALLVAVLSGFIARPAAPFALHFLLVLGISFAIHAIWKRGIKVDIVFKDTLISALIIALLLEPAGNWMEVVPNGLAAAIAMLLRIFGRHKGMPVANPAATSILAVTILSMTGFVGLPVASWWGANYAVNIVGHSFLVGTAISMVLALLVVAKLRKWTYALVFFVAFALVSWYLQGANMLAYMLTDGTLFFFFGLMACEPKTAPVGKYAQVVTGMVLALMLAVALAWHWPAEYFLAIVVANLTTLAWKKSPISKDFA